MGYGVGGLDYPRAMKMAGGFDRWTIPGWQSNSVSNTSALVNGEINYQPIFVNELTTFIRVGVKVTALQAGQTLDLRLFTFDDGYPGDLIEDLGNVSLNAVASVEIVIARTLPRGYYYLARRTSGGAGATLEGLGTAGVGLCPVSGFNVGIVPWLWVASHAVAAWADPAPVPTAYDPVNDVAIMLREV